MPSKESQLMRMPSDLRGPDKYNPCVGCGHCREGYCETKKAWAFKVKGECVDQKDREISPELAEERRKTHKAIDGPRQIKLKPEHKAGPKGKPVRCIETGMVYPSSVAAAKATKVHQGSVSKCCSKAQMTAGGFRWEYV